jgi:hypothetical protein
VAARASAARANDWHWHWHRASRYRFCAIGDAARAHDCSQRTERRILHTDDAYRSGSCSSNFSKPSVEYVLRHHSPALRFGLPARQPHLTSPRLDSRHQTLVAIQSCQPLQRRDHLYTAVEGQDARCALHLVMLVIEVCLY